MDSVLTSHGWTIRVRVRERKKPRTVKGRKRGFYEWKTIELRVTSPEGRVRDIHLGTVDENQDVGRRGWGEKSSCSSSPATSTRRGLAGEKNGGEESHNERVRRAELRRVRRKLFKRDGR